MIADAGRNGRAVADGSIPSAAVLKQREYRRRYREKHRAKIAEHNRIYRQQEHVRERDRNYKRNPELQKKRWRKTHFKRAYGITIDERDAIFNENNGLCQICNLSTSEHLDHDHLTGVIRGALCHPCNVGLGFFGDNPQRLRDAATYLERCHDLCLQAEQ